MSVNDSMQSRLQCPSKLGWCQPTKARERGARKEERSPKLPWRGAWQFGCIGCGVRNGTTSVEKVRSARGPARNRRWCASEHRVIDWAVRSLLPGVRTSNPDRTLDRRDAWVGLSLDLNFDCERSLVGHGTFQLERNDALLRVQGFARFKYC